MKNKVLVFGDVSNNIEGSIAKANGINKKNGPFECLILLGSPPSSTTIPDCDIPVYYYSTDDSRPGAVVPNSPVTTSGGLTIGSADDESEGPSKKVDILITKEYPRGIDPALETAQSSEKIKQAVMSCHPRYHFASNGGEFHERAPFKWDSPGDSKTDEKRFTRFINLAEYQGKSKWFYAFNIDSAGDLEWPADVTKNPFNKKRKKEKQPKQQNQKEQKRAPVVTPDTCFFCLSCPQLDKNLIVSIADETYAALAKGPLPTPDNGLKCPGHVLIIPVSHVPTLSSLPQPSQDNVRLEIHKYLAALRQTYSEAGMELVAFEISRSRGVHFHIQVMPVPKDKSDKLEEIFMESAPNAGLTLHKRKLDADETEYFQVLLPSNETLIAEIPRGTRFDLQFGRRAIAKVLGVENRVDWRKCAQTAEEEAKDAAQFKECFKPFDFTV